VIGGAHIGFNYQIDKPLGGFVLGVEVPSTALACTKASRPALLPSEAAPCPRPRTRTSRVLFAAASASPGIGLLAYATGGVAFGGFQHQLFVHRKYERRTSPAAPSSARTAFRTRAWLDGWRRIDMRSPTIGQYSRNYRYNSFGTVGIPGLPPQRLQRCRLCRRVLFSNRTLSQSQVQVGFSYKFDTALPARTSQCLNQAFSLGIVQYEAKPGIFARFLLSVSSLNSVFIGEVYVQTIHPAFGWRDRHDRLNFRADLAPPSHLPAFTWSGVYLGGQIGYAWGKDNVSWSAPTQYP